MTSDHRVFLEDDELRDVLQAPLEHRRKVFACGVIRGNVLELVRGDGKQVHVPLSVFTPSGKASPDFMRFALVDYGLTLQFGDYEATAESVMPE